MARDGAATLFERATNSTEAARGLVEDFTEQAFRTAFSMSEVMQHTIERNTRLLGAMQAWIDQNTKLLKAVHGWIDQNARLVETMQRATAQVFRPLHEGTRA